MVRDSKPSKVQHSPTDPSGREAGYEYVDHPSHYRREGSVECIDEMMALFGREAVMWFCALSAYKYRYRAGDKPGNDARKDIAKSDWYMNKYCELMKSGAVPEA